jgi:hypothetical protein
VAALPARAPEPDNGFAPEPDLAQVVPDATPTPADTRGETQPAHSPARAEPAPAAGPGTGPRTGLSAAPARAASRSGGPAVIPLIHAPDDPGPDRDGEAAERPAARVYPAAFR